MRTFHDVEPYQEAKGGTSFGRSPAGGRTHEGIRCPRRRSPAHPFVGNAMRAVKVSCAVALLLPSVAVARQADGDNTMLIRWERAAQEGRVNHEHAAALEAERKKKATERRARNEALRRGAKLAAERAKLAAEEERRRAVEIIKAKSARTVVPPEKDMFRQGKKERKRRSRETGEAGDERQRTKRTRAKTGRVEGMERDRQSEALERVLRGALSEEKKPARTGDQ